MSDLVGEGLAYYDAVMAVGLPGCWARARRLPDHVPQPAALPRPAGLARGSEHGGGVAERNPPAARSILGAVLRVLTNDDGIDAEGLQALRRALVALDGHRARGDRAGRQPLRHRALDHVPPPAVGRARSTFDDGTVGYALRRHAGGLRAARLARPDRGLRARPDRLRHQPRRQPGRRHHLLAAPSRPRWRASCSASRASPVSQQSARARDGLPARATVRLRRSAAAFIARVVDRLDDVPLPRGHAAQRQRARRRRSAASRSRGWASASTRTSST